MSADIKQLRTRIKSVDSTLHLTKAMELVASSKIRRATDACVKGNQYSAALQEIVTSLCSYEECKKSPYMAQRDIKRICIVVIAGDRGLAGGYNANIFRLMREYETANVIAIGKRACERFGGDVITAEKFNSDDAKKIADKICQDFISEKFDKVGIVCTKYHSMISQEAYIKWLLPLQKTNSVSTSAIFEPDEITMLNSVIPQYIAGTLVACVKESFACEVAARRVAMDNAGKNAQEMLETLGLEYNRARQGAITQEITEIVAGSDM